MSPVAPLVREGDARRAPLLAVAAVHDGVVAVVAPGAALGALGRPRAARHRREERLRAAVAAQLVEGDVRAGVAVAAVARVLASVIID